MLSLIMSLLLTCFWPAQTFCTAISCAFLLFRGTFLKRGSLKKSLNFYYVIIVCKIYNLEIKMKQGFYELLKQYNMKETKQAKEQLKQQEKEQQKNKEDEQQSERAGQSKRQVPHQEKEKGQQMDFFVIHKPKNQNRMKNTHRPKPFDLQMLTNPRKPALQFQTFQRIRFPSDQVICRDEDSLSLCQSITCPICLMIFQTPYYECQGCSNGFCVLCLQSWWAKSPKTCAYKCTNVEFKLVKRSNTLNAVMAMLKSKCQFCREQVSLSEYGNHVQKSCQQVSYYCKYCDQKITRRLIQQHESQQCKNRPWRCDHCELQYFYREKQQHDDICQQRQVVCMNESCNKKIRLKQEEEHIKKCDFRKKNCDWCKMQMIKKQYESHILACSERTSDCIWCNSTINIQQYNDHEIKCQLRKQSCRLCKQFILSRDINGHKLDCMFESLVDMKNKNENLETENIRLKQKIMILEGILEETKASSRSSAMNIVNQMRENDKKIVEKDLLRLDNSIKSVEKLKKEQFASHMKFPHLIQSWCPICRELEKKFKAMLQPLIEQRKQTLNKLAQINRFSGTPQQA